MNRTNKTLEKITSDSADDCRRIAKTAREEAEALIRKYDERILAYQEDAETELGRQTDELFRGAKDTAAGIRDDLLDEYKKRVIDDTYMNAISELCEMPQEWYVNLIVRLVLGVLMKNIKECKEDIELIFNGRDQDIGGAVALELKNNHQLSPDVQSRIVLSDNTEEIEGGVIVRCGSITENCSFEFLVKEIREKTEEKISDILFSE